jgi:exosortase/archaeosortase family protein
MTVAKPLDAPIAGTQSAASRSVLYAATVVVSVANAAVGKSIVEIGRSGVREALANGLGLSWAFWFAFAVCVAQALREPAAPVRARDWVVCAVCALAALFPLSQVAGFACTALSLAMLTDRTTGRYMKAAAIVLLAISVQLLWSRLFMLFFMTPVANLDAHIVGGIIGKAVIEGNTVPFADGHRSMTILAACTSVENASIALMLYVAVVRCFRPEPRRIEALALVCVFLSVVAFNIARLTVMAQSLSMYHLVHSDTGLGITNALVTLVGLAWAVASVRREVFR